MKAFNNSRVNPVPLFSEVEPEIEVSCLLQSGALIKDEATVQFKVIIN